MDRVLPLGSVVTLKGSSVRLMIVGYIAKSTEDGKYYDYCACVFPNGLDLEKQVLFNIEDIDVIFFVGYQNRKMIAATKIIKDCIDELDSGKQVSDIINNLSQKYGGK